MTSSLHPPLTLAWEGYEVDDDESLGVVAVKIQFRHVGRNTFDVRHWISQEGEALTEAGLTPMTSDEVSAFLTHLVSASLGQMKARHNEHPFLVETVTEVTIVEGHPLPNEHVPRLIAWLEAAIGTNSLMRRKS